LAWGRQLYELLTYLESIQIYLEITPEAVEALDGGLLKLIHLRNCDRSIGHPNFRIDIAARATCQMAFGRTLTFWLGQGASAQAAQLASALSQGNFQGSVQDFDQLHLASSARRVRISAESHNTCLTPGTRVGGYELEFLTEGGMSVCYRGRAGHLLRFIKEVDCRDGRSATALRREYEFLSVLDHPNVVRCHQAFEQSGYLYLVMDFVDGISLEDWSHRPDYASPTELQLLQWLEVLCDLLAYLHSCSTPIIYRDLKPGNVILTSQGQLRLIDFGIARTFKAGHSKDTEALGTVLTASPEHFYGQTGLQSDLYCLGATIYLLACPSYRPSVPFSWQPLNQINPRYSTQLADILATCLQPDPSLRWADAPSLGLEVRRLLQAGPAAPTQTSRLRENFQIGDLRSVLEEARQIPNLAYYVSSHTRRLATRLKRPGAKLEPTLKELSRECDIRCFSRIFTTVAEQVERGCSLPAALAFFPGVFPEGYLKFLDEAAQSTPLSLGNALEVAADHLDQEDLRSRTRSSLIPSEGVKAAQIKRTHWKAVGFGSFTVTTGLMAAASATSQRGSWDPITMSLGGASTIGLLVLGGIAIRETRIAKVQNTAQNLLNDAWTSYAKGQTDQAARELSKALMTAKDGLGASDLTTLSSLHSLANLQRQREDFGTAHGYYQQAVSIYQAVLPPQHPARGQLHFDFAQNYVGVTNTDEAFKELDRSMAIWRANFGQHALELSEVQFYKGRLHFELKEYDAALNLFSESLEIQYEKLGIRSSLVHRTLSFLTKVYVRQGRLKESEPHLARLIRELDEELDPDYAALAEANLDMGSLRLQEGKLSQAHPYILRCLHVLQSYVGPNEWLLERAMVVLQKIYGRDDDQSHMCALIIAFMKERSQVRPLLEQHPELLEGRDNTGWGLLQWAIFLGREDIVQLLLQRRIDCSYDPGRNLGPLHVACAWNRQGSLRLLLDRGHYINSKGPNGWSPLFYCAFTGHEKLMELLLERGADVRGRDANGRTALHLATSRDHLRMVAALLSSGAEVNAQESILGSTPLHLAAERGNVAICECLIFNEGNLTIKDKAGQTPLDLARSNQHRLVERELRKYERQGFGKQPKK
jgi:ankyrin repeat protein/serine/threonine protein kinase